MLPLQDVTVVALEQYGAGPWATLQLADLGARVIKIEDPEHGGDVSRYVPPYQEGESSLFFETFNRNKESVRLDLRHPQARGVFEDMVRGADAVFSNLRGDQPEKLGLRYADLATVNKRIIADTETRISHLLRKKRVKKGWVNHQHRPLRPAELVFTESAETLAQTLHSAAFTHPIFVGSSFRRWFLGLVNQ